MNVTTIEQKVRAVIAEQLGVNVEAVTDTASLRTELGADDLDMIEMTMKLEDEFAVEIPTKAYDKFKNARDVIDYVTKAREAA